MSSTDTTAAERWEPHSAKAARLGVSTKTLDRWARDGVIERPVYIQRRKYHRVHTEPRRDGETAAG